MLRTMRLLLAALLLTGLPAGAQRLELPGPPLPAAASTKGKELDGTEWRCRRGGFFRALLFWKRDTLRFEDGRFLSADALLYGFLPAAYEVKGAGAGMTWKAVLVNRDGDRLEWSGRRNGRAMRGSAVWYKSGGEADRWEWYASPR